MFLVLRRRFYSENYIKWIVFNHSLQQQEFIFRFDYVKDYLQLITQFNIIALREAWVNKEKKKGYEFVNVNGHNKGGGGGVSVFLNDSLKCKVTI